MKKIGFLINPIAGMGGKVGLKGTDGVVDRAAELGAEPVAHLKAVGMLGKFKKVFGSELSVEWLTCSGEMGQNALLEVGIEAAEVFQVEGKNTDVQDTKNAVKKFLDYEVDIIVFCGGDGTARDICELTEDKMPILGIPSGVKMYSGVFGISPERTAEILLGFIEDELTVSKVEILDLDEEKYRNDDWDVKLYDTALTPFESTYIQASKMMMSEVSENDIKEEIAEYIVELIKENPETLFILGPGSTTEFVSGELGLEKTLLGIDAVMNGNLVGEDLNEKDILALMDDHSEYRLVLSPIGAQGFVLGRGNLQLSPMVIRKVGRENIIVISTPAKLLRTPVLRFDTGDSELDSELHGKGYFSVVIGYRLSRLVKVEI